MERVNKSPKKHQYHIKGIGGRNKPKNNKPIPIHLMKKPDCKTSQSNAEAGLV